MLARTEAVLTCDASGGNAIIAQRLDPQYVAVCSWSTVRVSDALGTGIEVFIEPDQEGTYHMNAGNQPGLGNVNILSWVPPPLILEMNDGQITAPNFRVITSNADGETRTLNVEYYLYDKRVRELGRAEDLLALVGRGGTLFGSLQT